MIFRRPPLPLKEIAFFSWLTALDIGQTNIALAPPLFLTRALEGGTKLKDATVVRIVQEAAAAGVNELVINEELLNPSLFRQISEILSVHCSELRKLVLKLPSRVTCEEAKILLASALKRMVNLEELSLIGGADDELLKALANACPPLLNIDVSYSSVTDDGIQSLLTLPESSSRLGSGSLSNLQHLNVWETQVTTKGCMLILKYCHDLESLTSQWTAEALVLMDLKECNALRLEQLFIYNEELSSNLYPAIINLCPCLKLLSIRKPKDTSLNIEEFLTEFSNLEDFSLLQFYPLCYSELRLPQMPNLKRLYLSSVSPSLIDLTKLRESCPFLMYLTLDGVSLKLEYPTKEEINSPLNDDLIFHHLIELRIISAHINCEPLDPLLIVYLLTKMTKGIKCLHLDHCENFKEENFLSLFQEHSLTQVII